MALLLLLFIFVGMALVRINRGQDKELLRYASAGLLMHVVFAFAQQWVHASYYAGVSDVYHFAEIGSVISRALDLNFSSVAPEVLKMVIHVDAQMPFGWVTDGSSTSTTEALTGILFYLFGTSLWPSFLAVSIFAWFAQLLLAKTLSAVVRPAERGIAYASVFLVPSVVFWSSGITKEAFVFIGLCILCSGLYGVIARRQPAHLLTVGFGGALVGLIKPYTLFPLIVAVSVWLFIARQATTGRTVRVRLAPLMIACIVALGGVLLMGRIFPDFSLAQIGESAARQQSTWVDDPSGSQVDVGSSSASLTTQIPFIPIALINSLFRPFIFESRSLTAAAASVETTALMLLTIVILWRFRFKTVYRELLTSAALTAAMTFTLLFAIGVGLVTRNLGSLSRYRMPMIPFYVLTVLLLLGRLRAVQRSSPSPATLRQRSSR